MPAWLSPARLASILCLSLAAFPAAAVAQTPTATPDFGPNVHIFTPSTPADQIQSTLTSLANEDQFSTNRYAVFFMPGSYSIQAPVGYYESIAGLGETPNAVTIDGFLTPNFGVPVFGTSTWPDANITDTFWRSMENMTIDALTNTVQDAPPNTLQWGVSQGAPLRRMQINGSLELTDSFCGNASGGFISDTVVTGSVNPCSQQQWYTRNSTLGSWSGGVWNMVFSGVEGAPVQSYPSSTTSGPGAPITAPASAGPPTPPATAWL
jgi:Pectate lyase superfamily protein